MNDSDKIVYLNGKFLPLSQATIPVLDRGFIFGDGVYEVIPAYRQQLFRLDEHLERLNHSLSEVRISIPLSSNELESILTELVSKNSGEHQSLYLHITRGVANRDHAFPDHIEPTIFAMSSPLSAMSETIKNNGVRAITLEDIRWRYCHIKAIALLPNTLLRQQAIDQGAAEAILIRDGVITEGAASNVFIVKDNTIITPPKGPFLLPGITRDLILELANQNGFPAAEQTINQQDLKNAAEIWLSSSTKEILPVTLLDGHHVGNGKPGKVWKDLISLYQNYKAHYTNLP